MDCPPPDDVKVNVLVKLTQVGNPTEAGLYELGGLAFNKKGRIVAGPSFSEEFAIVPSSLHSIEVSPSHDITLRAGEFIPFSAVGRDRFGNLIENLTFDWTLSENSDSIGLFVGSVFQARRIGQGWAAATANGISGLSGRITVIPGDLAKMSLSIFPEQVVGQPFLQQAEITLYDRYDNLKIDYNLPANPITITSSDGSLEPNILDNQSLFSGGVINMIPAEITYTGFTAVVDIVASTGTLTSNPADVSFNGYDILAVTDAVGDPLTQLFAGSQNILLVVVQNNGRTKPSTPPLIQVDLKSGAGSAEVYFSPESHGVAKKVQINLLVSSQSPEDDTLVIKLSSQFEIGGQSLPAAFSVWEIPVDIVTPPQFSFVEGSFLPDTIYPSITFDISFDIDVDGFTGPIQRTDLVVMLGEIPQGKSPIIYEGSPDFYSFENGIISYRGLEAFLDPGAGLPSGWHTIRMEYTLTSGGVQYGLTDKFPDSIFVLPEIQVNYVANSLEPTTVYAGAEAGFQFYIHLDNDYSLAFRPEKSRFALSGEGFFVTTNLIFEEDSLRPGNNLIRSETLFIPENQSGESLHAIAIVILAIPGVGAVTGFRTDFDNQAIFVEEPPAAQIVEVSAIAPNAPRVNTGQLFQVKCRVANLSGSPLGPLDLLLSSDGLSIFDSILTISNISPHDTLDVHFNVTASQQPNPSEMFRVDILTPGISQLPPVDNVALVIIERPAELELTYSLNNVDTGVVGAGDTFSLMVQLRNLGDAATSNGTYILTTGGVDFGTEDTLSGVIAVDEAIHFPFRAPKFDTTATFVFSLVDIPRDLNTNTPAIMEDTFFEFTIRVVFSESEVVPDRFEESFVIENNPFHPEVSPARFKYKLSRPSA
ncbi:MAG: hypothetical protein ACE5K8_08865, partial [Candidatus Zixiibacteriota bacterium]